MVRPSGPPELTVTRLAPPGSYKQHHRLLYRGSLSLPDADLILDGTDQPTFTVLVLMFSSRYCFYSSPTSHFAGITLRVFTGVSS